MLPWSNWKVPGIRIQPMHVRIVWGVQKILIMSEFIVIFSSMICGIFTYILAETEKEKSLGFNTKLFWTIISKFSAGLFIFALICFLSWLSL